MNVTPDGKVTWHVPPKFASGEVTHRIKVTDGSGLEIIHTLDILVR